MPDAGIIVVGKLEMTLPFVEFKGMMLRKKILVG